VTRLLALRHAATDWNEAGLLQGRAERGLSAAGRAAAAAWRLPSFAAGWTLLASPLRRAQETAALLGPQVVTEPALIEMSWGAWEGHSPAELRRDDPRFTAEETRGLDFTPPGGESPRQVAARLAPWLAGLERDSVAVTHKGVLRALLHLATGWAFQGKAPAKPRAGVALLFALEGGRLSLMDKAMPLA
jgi:probable phosphoglycerate mutase